MGIDFAHNLKHFIGDIQQMYENDFKIAVSTIGSGGLTLNSHDIKATSFLPDTSHPTPGTTICPLDGKTS